MEFLAKTATIVLTVLASVFSRTEAPQAHAIAKPAAQMAPASFVRAEVPEVPSIALPGAHVVILVEQEPAKSPANERFIRVIKSSAGPKSPNRTIWYLTDEMFAPKTAEGVIRAFVTGEGFSQ